MRSHMAVIARNLAISSTKRMPAFTKNEMDPNTRENSSAGMRPESRTASSTSMAVAMA